MVFLSLALQVDRLHFGEVFTAAFQITIDPSSTYAGFVTSYGAAPPSQLQIPYNVIYYKSYRYKFYF
jgi:hypothetical protein